MARPTIIAGNWKMYKTGDEAESFVKELVAAINGADQVLLATPFTVISRAKSSAEGSAIRIGAQNMHDANDGAFTGEISAPMLQDIGAEFVLLGHSERRHVFGEDNAFINRKVVKAQEAEIQPVLCVGETIEQREAGEMKEVLKSQIEQGLAGVKELSDLVLAYEPVWAIGTGLTATPEQAEEAHAFCREVVASVWSQETAAGLPILYGGSVKPANAAELIGQKNIDGVLVGGASLEAATFAEIVNYQKSKV